MIQKSVWLPCDTGRAFALFTERASEWWPESRRHLQDPRSEIRLVPEGRFWERASDGREQELGWVRVWEAPGRLVLDFYPGTDAQHPTEVVVTFVAEGAGTRVTVDHRPTPLSEAFWKQRAPQFERAWTLLLEALSACAERGT